MVVPAPELSSDLYPTRGIVAARRGHYAWRRCTVAMREASHSDAPKPRLLDQVRAAIRARHYSRRTEDAYVAWIRRFIVFHDKRIHPGWGRPRSRVSLLAGRRRQGGQSTQNQALFALLFLYRAVLGRMPIACIARARRPERLPVVLTRDEVRALLARLDGPRLMADLLYGAGLRVLECLRLRVKDVDFGENQLVVRAARETRTGSRSCRP